MNFLNENKIYIQKIIQIDLCMKSVTDEVISKVANHPIVLWHSKGGKICLQILAKNSPIVDVDILDAIGLVFTGMGWPRSKASPKFHNLFNELINTSNTQKK